MQRLEQRNQFGALGLGGQQPLQPLVGATLALVGTRRQGVDQPLQFHMGIAELPGVDQVLGELSRQSQHHRGDRGRGLVGVQLRAVPVDHVEGHLPQLGLAEQPAVGLHGQQQAVVTQHRAGKGVVGADRRGALRVGVPIAGRVEADAGQPGQPGPDAAQQLAGGLAGEGQSQYLAGFGVAVGDEPYHPRGHRLGFARARPRDDDQWARRRANDRGLLVGWREKA